MDGCSGRPGGSSVVLSGIMLKGVLHLSNFMLLAIDWGRTITVPLSMMVIVFAALIIFVIIFWLFGKVFGGKKKAVSKPKAIVTEVHLAPKAVPAPVPAAAAEDGEIVAAITAAIMAFTGSGNFTIRRITRAQSGRPVWANAGILENTRPF